MRKIKGIDDSFRLQVIDEHLNGASKYSLARKYNLKSTLLISRWMSNFGIATPKGSFTVMQNGFKDSDEVSSLKKELKQAKAALAYEKMRADAFDKMIQIAEKQFNLPIRKKAGTKQ